ncbi:uncharacterized protein EI97DRAFT_453473 [Westerdykella ornata]|uniref:Asteroid domain-containing protein n=1 Tax=Westerdykella ornata TaxID=318751 RepID=A0A6A6J756_WESOR|nr:uncharacterized protein EI97DRAFT_453473 [Westerdykella ornata]KAF2271838.1 hypothetical protein EI97DRAFT_453473 [Westerdykella ornata]
MGIPGLATRLEPYALFCTFADLATLQYEAIIDGPALAYWAHSVAAQNQTRFPGYTDINTAAIRWLQHLESSGIKVSAILFDGALPPSKKEERASRLLQIVKRVTQLNVASGNTNCPIQQLGSVAFPFLAPALREALLSSEFAGATRVVPGEADDWCASQAQQNPHSIIFTSDTDLLLYEYSEHALVQFFKDVDEKGLKVYSPYKICQQLGLESLVQLAYATHKDRWQSLSESVHSARRYDAGSIPYTEFNKRYIDRVEAPAYLSADPRLHASLQKLDARVSEFVLQALSPGDSASQDPPLAIPVSLPLLIEDPFRASAWTQGQDIRLLAYSLLTRRRLVIQEHVRRAQGISVQELGIHPLDKVEIGVAALHRAVSTALEYRELPPIRYWTLIAVKLALASLKPPHISLLSRVVAGEFDSTWSFVHLQSCIQATLYSLRMLGQCIEVWLALVSTDHIAPEKKPSQELFDLINDLFRILTTLPPIAELFPVPGQQVPTFPEDANLVSTLKDIYAAAGITDELLFSEAKSKKQRKKEKRIPPHTIVRHICIPRSSLRGRNL